MVFGEAELSNNLQL